MNRKKLSLMTVLTAALLLLTIGAYGAGDDERDRDNGLVDVSEILREVTAALDEIPWGEIQGEVENALEEVDWDEIRVEVDEALEEVDWDEIRVEVDEAMDEVREALAEIDVEIGDAMDEADIGDEVGRAVREAMRGVEEAMEAVRRERD